MAKRVAFTTDFIAARAERGTLQVLFSQASSGALYFIDIGLMLDGDASCQLHAESSGFMNVNILGTRVAWPGTNFDSKLPSCFCRPNEQSISVPVCCQPSSLLVPAYRTYLSPVSRFRTD